MTKSRYIAKQTKRILNIKLDLEKSMIRDVRKYFAEQKRRLRRGEDITSIADVYQNHYNRIIRKLTHRRVKQSRADDITLDNVQTAFVNRAEERADIADATTRRNWERAQEQARQQLIEQGDTNPSQAAINATTANIFGRRSKSRAPVIANFETQQPVEMTRFEITKQAHNEMLQEVIPNRDTARAKELAEISDDWPTTQVANKIDSSTDDALIAIVALAQKMWKNVGDNRVRTGKFDHRQPDGQIRPVALPFEVSGELLMYPGDTSLGASTGNVAGCRCSAIVI